MQCVADLLSILPPEGVEAAAPDTVVPPLTVYGGAPAKLVRHLHPNFGDDLRTFMVRLRLSYAVPPSSRNTEAQSHLSLGLPTGVRAVASSLCSLFPVRSWITT